MYKTYYQLKAKPFTLLPDPEFLFLGTRHKMAMSLLEYGLVSGAAFIVITGEPGTGKTTLLNRLLDQSRRQWTIGVLANTHEGLGGLMPWVTASFGLETKEKNSVELFHAFAKFLESEQTAGRRVLLVIDEAQNVGSAMLEELRLLSNLNDGRRRSLQILLSGQPALRDLLKGLGMEQFAQRIAVEYALEPLHGEEEAIAYIGHRVQVAGGRRPLFSTLACRKIFALTGGVPRLINQLCDHALVYGYAVQAETITARIVLDAARVRNQSGFISFRADLDSVEPSQRELEDEAAHAVECAPMAPKPPLLATRPKEPVASDLSETYREAVALRQAGEFTRAISLFDRVIGDRELGLKAGAQKGLCLKAIGRYEEALTTFRAALDRPSLSEEQSVSLRYLLARTLEVHGRPDEASAIYRALRQSNREYRDVTLRINSLERLVHNGHARSADGSWFGSFFRECGERIRGAHAHWFAGSK